MSKNRDRVEKKLNGVLTVVLVLCAALCLGICIKTIKGEQASIFGYRFYHILTGSMEPTIPTGSNVLVKEVDPYALKKGDIITFISKDAAIYGSANTHRIISVEKDDSGSTYYVTRGDANKLADSVPVYPEDVQGKVVFHMNSRFFSNFWGFLHTGPGFVTTICCPVLFVCWCLMREFKKQVDEMVRQNAALELEKEKQESGTGKDSAGGEKAE